MSASPPISFAAIDRDNPWPGLATFTEDQRAYFHGRDEEIIDLTQLAERRPLVVLFGQSGLGKSSILQAGVFPRMRTDGFCPIYIRLDHGDAAPSPTEQIKAMVRTETAKWGTWTKPGVAQPGETLWEFFHHRDDRLLDRDGLGVVPVLVFDQFEELFTLGAARGERRERAVAFMKELAELVENRPSAQLVARLDQSSAEMEAFDFGRTDYRVIISLREDFLPDLETLKTIMPALMQKRMRLSRMTGTQALEAVLKPGGAVVTDDVARAIVEFVAGARGGSAERLAELDVEPALLSVICRELNERRRALGQAQITADLVTGNRREILTDFYERSVADLPAGMRTFVEDHLLTKSGFRDNLALETALEFSGVTQPLIDTLVARRLLRIEDRAGIQRVELTHDVLAEVIRTARDARQQRVALEQAREHEQRVLAAATRRTHRQRWIIGGLAAVVLVLCAAGLFGLRQRRLEFQRISRTDFGTASRLIDEGKTTDGLAHLLRAARRDPHNPAIAPRLASLLTSRNFLLPEGAAVTHPSPVLWTDFSADGKSAAVLWQDGAYGRIDLATGAVERSQLPSPPVVGFGTTTRGFFVIRCRDGVIRVLDKTGQLTREFRFEAELMRTGLRSSSTSGSARTYSGDFFSTTLADQTMVVCDAATGRTLPPIPFENPSFLTTTGKWYLWGESRGRGATETLPTVAHLRDTATGTTEITLRAPFGAYVRAISPTGRQVVAVQRESENNALFLRRYSLPDGAPLAPAQPVEGAVVAPRVGGVGLLYSPDGRYIVTWATVLEVWDAETGARIARIATEKSNRGWTEPLFSPDNQTLATYSNIGSLDLWDLATGNPRVPALKHGGNVIAARFSADGNVLLTTATDGFVRVWDVATGQLLAEPTLQLRSTPITAISPDRTQVTIGTREGAWYRFRIGQGRAKSVALPRTPQPMPAPFLPASPSRLLQMLGDRARVIDAASGREVPGGFAYPEPIRPWLRGNERGNATTDRSRVRTDFKVMVVQTVPGPWQAWWLGDGKIEKVVPLADAPDETTTGSNVAFSAVGDRVVFATPRWLSLRVWDLRTGQPVGPTIATSASILALTRRVNFSPDGARVTVGVRADVGLADGVGRVWDAATGKEVFRFENQANVMPAILFSPDGSRIATTSTQGEAQFWDGRTGEAVGSVLFHSAAVHGAEFSPDGNLLTHAADGEMRLWDRNTSTPIGEPMPLGLAPIASVKFSPDGGRVVTASSDGTARLWDVRSTLPATEPLMQGKAIVLAEFSPDGRFVRTETADNVFHLWSVPPPLPAGEKTPEWLLDLAAICAGKTLNEEGRFIPSADAFGKIAGVRQTLADLPDDAPYVEWGRWFLSDRATRSVAPGFTITPAEAEKLADTLSAPAPKL